MSVYKACVAATAATIDAFASSNDISQVIVLIRSNHLLNLS